MAEENKIHEFEPILITAVWRNGFLEYDGPGVKATFAAETKQEAQTQKQQLDIQVLTSMLRKLQSPPSVPPPRNDFIYRLPVQPRHDQHDRSTPPKTYLL